MHTPFSHVMFLAVSTVVVSACAVTDLTDPPVTGPPEVSGVSVSAPSTNVGIGTTLQLSAFVAPTGANASVTWSSDDETRIAVSATGLTTAALLPLTAGTVRITATSVEDPTISGSADLTIVCGPLTASDVSSGATLPEDTCYTAESPLSVNDGTLLVEPGVEIAFGSGGALSIGSNGRLSAIGTADQPITFTSLDPAGLWRGIRFDGSASLDNRLEHVVLENGGSIGWGGGLGATSALYLVGNTRLDVVSSEIRGSGGTGLTVHEDVVLGFSANTVSDNAVAAWVHTNAARSIGADNVWDGNAENVVRVAFIGNERVGTAQRWAAIGVPFEIQTTIYVNAPLTLDPGVQLTFRSDVSMIVQTEGSLTAIGTGQAPIEFSGTEDLPGFWNGLQITSVSADNVFDNVILENGGAGISESRAMVSLASNSKAVFRNSLFRGSGHYALRVPAGGDIEGFSGNAFADNARVMILHPNRAGSISSETVFDGNAENKVRVTFGNNDAVLTAQTWSALAVPYRVMTRTFIRAPLTIDAGAELEFTQNASFVLTGDGTLNAMGTVTDRIIFRGSEALAGYWMGIQIGTASAANRFEYVDFLHGGSDQWFGGATSVGTLYVTSDGSTALENVTIGLTSGYAAIISSGGLLTCTNVDSGGALFWYYLGSGEQPTC